MVERKNNGGEIRGYPSENMPKTAPIEGTPVVNYPYRTSGDITKTGTTEGFGLVDTLGTYQDGGEIQDTEDEGKKDYSKVMQAKSDLFKKLYAEQRYKEDLGKELEKSGGSWNKFSREIYYEWQNSVRGRDTQWDNKDIPSPIKNAEEVPIYRRIPWYRSVQLAVTKPFKELSQGLEWAEGYATDAIHYMYGTPKDIALGTESAAEKIAGTQLWPLRALKNVSDSFEDILKDDGSVERFKDAISDINFDNVKTFTPNGFKNGLSAEDYKLLTESGADLSWDVFNVATTLLAAGELTSAKAAVVGRASSKIYNMQYWLGAAGSAAAYGGYAWNKYKKEGNAKDAAISTILDALDSGDIEDNAFGLDFSDDFIDKVLTKIPGVEHRTDYKDIGEFLTAHDLSMDDAIKLFIPDAHKKIEDLEPYKKGYAEYLGNTGVTDNFIVETDVLQSDEDNAKNKDDSIWDNLDLDISSIILEEKLEKEGIKEEMDTNWEEVDAELERLYGANK